MDAESKPIVPILPVWRHHLDFCEQCRHAVRLIKFSGGVITHDQVIKNCCNLGRPICIEFYREVGNLDRT